jgi:hypothetical protein
VNDTLQVSDGAEVANWQTPYDNMPYELACPSHTYTNTNANGSLSACLSSAVLPQFIYSSGPPYSFTVESAATSSPLFTCQ